MKDDPKRFAFGANWANFLSVLDDDRIAGAEESLRDMLGVEHLQGKRFLDIGSGSGLFSLAARRLGARVHSFDYDPQSVACTAELRRRYFPEDGDWQVEQGSVLNGDYLAQLGQFDVVYSWGVLHHTGAMWLGIEHARQRVRGGGRSTSRSIMTRAHGHGFGGCSSTFTINCRRNCGQRTPTASGIPSLA